MADELKDQRIPIMMSPSEVKAIDDWMFSARIKSRAEAIRRLCQVALVFHDLFPALYNGVADGTPFLNNLDNLNPDTQPEQYYKILSDGLIDALVGYSEQLDDLKQAYLMLSTVKMDVLEDISAGREDLYQALKAIREKEAAKKDETSE